MASKKNFQFEVDVNGDISGLKQAMNKAVAEFNSMDRSLRNIQKARELAPKDEKLLTMEMQQYIKAIHEGEVSLKQLYQQRKQLLNDPNFKKGHTETLEQYTALTKKIKEVQSKLKELKKERDNLPTREQDRINRKFDEYVKAVSKAVEETERYKKVLANIDKQIELDPTNADLYAQRQTVMNELLNTYKQNLDDVNTAKQRFESSSNDTFYQKHEKEISDVTLAVDKLGKEYKENNEIIQNTPTPDMSVFARQMENLSAKMGDIASKTAMMSRAFRTILADGFNVAKEYETDVANIRKVAGDLSDDVVEDLKRIAIETGKAFSDVSEYATISAALGLAGDEIADYTKALIDLNAVSGGAFSGEEGAKAVAVFLKQLNLGTHEAENFGSAISVIGDAYADIGDETLTVATRLSSIATLVNTNQYELIGLAGVMADLGLSADSNANAINRAFLQITNIMSDTSKKGQKKMKELAETAGMSAKEFKEAWGADAVDAFLKFTDGLKSSVFNEINDALDSSSKKVEEYAEVLGWSADVFKEKWSDNSKLVFDQYIEKLGELGEEGQSASTVLKDLGLSTVMTAQTLLRLAGSGNEVRKAISMATDAWEQNTALQEKTNILYSTTENKLNSFLESLRQLKASLIESSLPAIKDVIDGLTRFSKSIAKMNPNVQKLVLMFLSLGAATSPVARYIKNMADVVSLFAKNTGQAVKTADNISKVAQGVSNVTAETNILKGVWLTLPKALSVAGIIAGVTALGFAIYKAYEKSKDVAYYAKQDMLEIGESSRKLQDELRELNKEIANNTNEWENNQRPMYNQAAAIDDLYRKIRNGYLTDKEAAEAKKELKERIEELNKALGENKWNFDETKQAIVDEKGEIVDALIPAYQELAIERKKSYMLEEMQDEYMQALKNEEDFLKRNKEARLDYIKVLADARDKFGDNEWYNDEFIQFAENYKNLGVEGAKAYAKMTDEQKKAFAMISSAKAVLDGTLESIEGVHLENQKLVEFYEKLTEVSGKEAEKLMEVWQTFGETDFANIELEKVKEQLKEIDDILAERRLLTEEEISAYETAKSLLEDYYNQVFEYQTREKLGSQEIYDENDKLRKESIEKLKEDVDKLYNHEDGEIIRKVIEGTDQYTVYQEQRHKDMWLAYFDEATQEADAVQEYINAKTYEAHVHLIVDNLESIGGFGASTVMSKSTQLYQSGGFGDLFSGIYNAIRTSMQNIQSGGFNSGGITVNANFTINNGNDINQATVRGWGKSIAEQINEYLGSQI